MAFLRPPVADVYCVLRKRDALIVHFSGCPKGVGEKRPDHLYPVDLRHVIDKRAMGGVSCSVVSPGDKFHQPRGNNAIGTVGVVLGLTSPQSLFDVSAADCGSFVDAGGTRAPRPSPITLAEVEDSITLRPYDRYNEWVVGDYTVLGIFVAEPVSIFYLVDPETLGVPKHLAGTEQLPDIRHEPTQEVAASFRDQRVFSFKANTVQELGPAGWSSVSHSKIYV